MSAVSSPSTPRRFHASIKKDNGTPLHNQRRASIGSPGSANELAKEPITQIGPFAVALDYALVKDNVKIITKTGVELWITEIWIYSQDGRKRSVVAFGSTKSKMLGHVVRQFADNFELLSPIMANDGKYMLLQINFKPKDENGIYNTGFATVASPTSYQSQQDIFEVITLFGPGSRNFTRDELDVSAVTGALDPDGSIMRACTRDGRGPLSPYAPNLDRFNDSFNDLINKLLAEKEENNTLETVTSFVKAPPLATTASGITTPPPPVPHPDPPMTVARAQNASEAVTTPLAVPSPGPDDLVAAAPILLEHGVGSPIVDGVVTAIGFEKLQATPTQLNDAVAMPASSTDVGSAGKRRKPAIHDAGTESSAGIQAASPSTATKKSSAKRRNTKVVDGSDDDERSNVKLTPIKVVSAVQALLEEEDSDA